MIRVRFFVDLEDYRPLTWPIKPPYWCSGYRMDGAAILVAHADTLEDIKTLWPEAEDIEVMQDNLYGYNFTGRFPKPDWFEV